MLRLKFTKGSPLTSLQISHVKAHKKNSIFHFKHPNQKSSQWSPLTSLQISHVKSHKKNLILIFELKTKKPPNGRKMLKKYFLKVGRNLKFSCGPPLLHLKFPMLNPIRKIGFCISSSELKIFQRVPPYFISNFPC